MLLEKFFSNCGGGDEVPVELFQTLKDDAVKVLQSICQLLFGLITVW